MDKNYLENINKVISELEDAQLFKEAEDLHNLFLKTAGKNKKTKGKNVPNDPALYARCKSEAKRKFDVWPSAYGSAYLVKLYKSKGGTFRKSSSENNIKTAQNDKINNLEELKIRIEHESNSKSMNPQLNLERLLEKYDDPDTYNQAGYMIDDAIRKLNNRFLSPKNTSSIGQAPELRPDQSVYSPDASSQIEKSVRPSVAPKVTGNAYLEMSYKQVIEKAKELFLNRRKEEADKLIADVIKGSIVLNDAQKTALKEHYNRIKFVFGDFGPVGTKNIPSQAYQEANDLIYKLKKKYNLEDRDLVTDTQSYYLILNGIKSYQGLNPEFTNKVKNYANNLLRQLSMDYKNK